MMRGKFLKNVEWTKSSWTWILSLLLGLSLLLFGLMGLLSPSMASRIYGVDFVSGSVASVFYLAKAVRDCMLAALLLNAVRSHNAGNALKINLVGLPISFCDALVVHRLQPGATNSIVFLHGGTLLALILVIAGLYAQRSPKPLPRERVVDPPRLNERDGISVFP